MLDENCRFVGILLREEMAALHRLSVRARGPPPPDAERTSIFCIESVKADHPEPTDAASGIRFVSMIPSPRGRVRHRLLLRLDIPHRCHARGRDRDKYKRT